MSDEFLDYVAVFSTLIPYDEPSSRPAGGKPDSTQVLSARLDHPLPATT